MCCGKRRAKLLIEKYISSDFFQSIGDPDYPYIFRHVEPVKVIDTPPKKPFNLLHLNITVGGVQEHQETEEEESVTLSPAEEDVQCDVDGEEQSHHISHEYQCVGESMQPQCSSEEMKKNRWYITRKVADKMEHVHVMTAFSMLIPREYVSRERSKRHIASVFVPGTAPVNPSHDIIKFRNYAIKAGADSLNIVKIIKLEDAAKTDVASCSRKDQSWKFRGRLYTIDDKGVISVPEDMRINRLRGVKDIVMEVTFDKSDCRGPGYVLSEGTKSRMVQMGYSPVTLKLLKPKIPAVEKDMDDDGHIGDGFYLIRDVSQPRWNSKTHCREYKVSFKGEYYNINVHICISACNEDSCTCNKYNTM